jgi:hypothetical protein
MQKDSVMRIIMASMPLTALLATLALSVDHGLDSQFFSQVDNQALPEPESLIKKRKENHLRRVMKRRNHAAPPAKLLRIGYQNWN